MSPFAIKAWLSASKKDLTAHLALDLWIGVNLMVDSPSRTAAPTFEPFKVFAGPVDDMRIWGAILTVLSLILAASMITGGHELYSVARWGLRALWGFVAGVFVVSFLNGDASPFSSGFGVLWASRTVRLPIESPWSRVQSGS